MTGDFNSSKTALVKSYPSLGKLIGTFYCSKNPHTAQLRRNQKVLKEIDHIYTSLPSFDVELALQLSGDIEETKLSDHLPIMVRVKGRKASRRIYTPNRGYAKAVTALLLSQ